MKLSDDLSVAKKRLAEEFIKLGAKPAMAHDVASMFDFIYVDNYGYTRIRKKK